MDLDVNPHGHHWPTPGTSRARSVERRPVTVRVCLRIKTRDRLVLRLLILLRRLCIAIAIARRY